VGAAPPFAITQLLRAWNSGDSGALDRLLPLVYDELRRVAHNRLRRERRDQTLQPTALVNEAYLRLVRGKPPQWQNRTQFFAVCARLMRQILVDAARRRDAGKRGGGPVRVTLNEDALTVDSPQPDVLALDEALNALEALDRRKSRVVELRFFAGLSVEETAAALDVSSDTVLRDWKFAKTWLYQELRRGRRPTR